MLRNIARLLEFACLFGAGVFFLLGCLCGPNGAGACMFAFTALLLWGWWRARDVPFL